MAEDLRARINDAQNRDRVLAEFSSSTLDPVGPVGKRDKEMRVLGEMNELGEKQAQIIQDGVPKINKL